MHRPCRRRASRLPRLEHSSAPLASVLSRLSAARLSGVPREGASAVAAFAAAATAAWAEETLAGLADIGTTLPDGTELLVGRITFAADGPAFTLPPDDSDPPDFAALAGEYADVLAGPPPGLPPDRGPAFELRIETGSHPMPRSRPMKRWSQGELDECRKQVSFLLDQGWIVPSSASHAASSRAKRMVRGASARTTAGSTPSRNALWSRCRT